MSELVKAAIIVGIAIVIGVAVWTYFSPYHTCVRAQKELGDSRAEIRCAGFVSGARR